MHPLIWLTSAILFEVAGTTSMKLSDGFTNLIPSILIFIFYGISFICLTFAVRYIDIGVAYAIWAGLGMALIAGIGVLWFHEPVTAVRVISLLLIIGGVVGLNLDMTIKH